MAFESLKGPEFSGVHGRKNNKAKKPKDVDSCLTQLQGFNAFWVSPTVKKRIGLLQLKSHSNSGLPQLREVQSGIIWGKYILRNALSSPDDAFVFGHLSDLEGIAYYTPIYVVWSIGGTILTLSLVKINPRKWENGGVASIKVECAHTNHLPEISTTKLHFSQGCPLTSNDSLKKIFFSLVI